jgi:hypothetical protein
MISIGAVGAAMAAVCRGGLVPAYELKSRTKLDLSAYRSRRPGTRHR